MTAGKSGYPAPNQAAAIGNLHRARRIKIRPAIQQPAGTRLEAARLCVKITEEILHLSVRRHKQHPLIAKLEKDLALCRARGGIRKCEHNAAIFSLRQA